MLVWQMESKKILIVDDEPEMRIYLSRLLESGGFNPIVAKSHEDALKKAASDCPALIILGLMIGKEGMMQLFPDLKADETLCKIPIIMLSTIDEKTFRHYHQVQTAKFGKPIVLPEAYLEKPPEADELLGLLENLVGGPGNG